MGQSCAALPNPQIEPWQADTIDRHSPDTDLGHVDVDALGKKRIALDLRPKPGEVDGFSVLDEEDEVRIADIDCAGLLQIFPADGHCCRVHGISKGNFVPAEPGQAHIYRRRTAGRCGREQAGAGFDDLRPQQRHAARRITAGSHLAPVGIPYPHADVGDLGRLQHDHLVAADARMSVRDAPRPRRVHRDGSVAGVENHEIVAEAMHLDETVRHGGAFRKQTLPSPCVCRRTA